MWAFAGTTSAPVRVGRRAGRPGRTRPSRRAAHRSPSPRPIVSSWSWREERSHTSISIRIRRATRYVPPRNHAGSSDRPDPDVLVERSRVLELDVVRPVLEAHEVARRVLLPARRRRAAEPELRPAHDDDTAADSREVADGVEGDLRIVGARLHAEVAAGAGRIERVARERRQLDERPRTPGLEPETVVTAEREERRAEAEGHRQPRAREPDRLAGIVRRSALDVVDGPAGFPAVIRAAASVHARMRSRTSPAESVTTSKAAK